MAAFIQQQNETRRDFEEDERIKHYSDFEKIAFNRITKGAIFLLLFSISVPVLIYFFMIDPVDVQEIHTCSVNNSYKIHCGGTKATTYEKCLKIKCCYDNTTKLCFHYLPSKYFYKSTSKGYEPSSKRNPFNTTMKELMALTINEIDPDRFKIILHDPSVVITPNTTANKHYRIEKMAKNLTVEAFRNGSDELILTTALGPLIVSDRYWEWSVQLSNESLFGFGENLIQVAENTTLTRVVYGNEQEHNVLPVFMAAKNKKFHGLIVRHSGPLEVTILRSNLISLKSLAGDRIELEVVLGPTPDLVRKQLRDANAVGLPEPWILGLHLCRGGNLIDLKLILDEYEKLAGSRQNLDYESDCINENLFLALLLSDDPALIQRLKDRITELEESGKKFVLSLPPHLPVNSLLYESTSNLDVFYKTKYNNATYEGQYLDLQMVYPYFEHESINSYLDQLFNEIFAKLGFYPQFLVLNNNWPVDEAFHIAASEEFPYLSPDLLSAMNQTLPWNTMVKDNITQHITKHNSYGSEQHRTITNYLTNKNLTSLTVMTASHDFSIQTPLTTQNVNITWTNFQSTIKRLLYNSIFVNPLINVPVCGSTKHYDPWSKHDESLCLRWYLLAATAPLLRVSSEKPWREPNSLSTEFSQNKAKEAIGRRNQLRNHFYRILQSGETLMRPMFYDFYEDHTTYELYNQYMVGKEILVAQPVLPGKSKLRVYLPVEVPIWYELWGGIGYRNGTLKDGWLDLFVVESDWISFLQPGNVIPLVENESLTLIVGLDCSVGSECSAKGSLLVQTQVLDLQGYDTRVEIRNINELSCPLSVSEIRIYSYTTQKCLYPTESINLCDPQSNGTVIIDNVTNPCKALPSQ